MTRPILLPHVVLLSLLVVLSCGSSCGSNRQLQSIAVSPNSADAQNFSGGMVQFAALGTYSGGSQGPVSSIQWCASPSSGTCNVNNIKTGVTISPTGLAQCDAGSLGTWTINADSPPVPTGGQPGGEQGASIIVGSATLTCP
jgi:hypothetical protein